jgi:hypothetical protein
MMPLFRRGHNDRKDRGDLVGRVARLMEDDRAARASLQQQALDQVLDTARKFENEFFARAKAGDVPAAGVLLDVSRICLSYQLAASNWYGAITSGEALCTAINRLFHGGGLAPDKLAELGYRDLETALGNLAPRLYGLPQALAYAAHNAGQPLAAVRHIETLTNVVFGLRMTAYNIHRLEQREAQGIIGYDDLEEHVRRLVQIAKTSRGGDGGKMRPDAIRATLESRLAQEMELSQRDLVDQYFLTTPAAHAARASAATGRTLVYVLTGPGDHGGVAIRVAPGGEFGWQADSTYLPALQTPAVATRIDQIHNRFQQAITQRRQAELTGHLRSMLEWTGVSVWRPMLDAWPDLLTTPLAIVPVGSAALLPLYTSTVNGTLACAEANLTIAPSARALHFATALPHPGTPGPAVVAADPWYGKNRLELVGEEARIIAAVHGVKEMVYGPEGASPGNSTAMRAFQGPLPTRQPGASQQLKGLLREAGLIHLTCHGTTTGPALLLGNDVVLLAELAGGDATEFTSTLRGRPLAVLSACQVGGFTTKDIPGEHFGFPAALLAMGARSVVGALWPVPDSRDTIEFMKDFHQRLRHKPSSVALPEAMLAAEGHGITPAVWGSFTHFGL